MQLGIQFQVGRVHHIGDEGQLVEVSVVHHLVVLLRQLHLLLLCLQRHVGLLVERVSLLHVVVQLLAGHDRLLLLLLREDAGLAQSLVAFEE